MENDIKQVIARADKFISRQSAFSSLSHCVKPHRVMLGCDGRFWIVTPADASRLERAGYEFAN